MEPFIKLVIRPPRVEYTVDDLLETEFSIRGRTYQRKDLEITNSRGQLLQCSHYVPLSFPEDMKLPCVIYCHGNSGCRADGNEAAIVLLPSNITVFTLDFSGSGLSHGDFVTLGWNEKDDLKAAVHHLRSLKQTSCIGLWGRSMGAVTSILYAAEDPSIAGMVLDSPFSNLFNLMLELADVYKIRLPKFTIRVALQIMRRIIQKRAQFDIMDMNIKRYASKAFIPALFGHAVGDSFIRPHHSDRIHHVYAGDKNIIKFEGNHNSPRPQFYYDSVTIFFHNILNPPAYLVEEETCKFLAFGIDDFPSLKGLVEHATCETLDDQILKIQNSDVAEGKEIISQQETTVNKLGESNSLKTRLEHSAEVIEFLQRGKHNGENVGLPSFDKLLESQGREESGDCCSYPTSNGDSTENWARCSETVDDDDISLERHKFAETPFNDAEEEEEEEEEEEKHMILRAITASLRDTDSSDADEDLKVRSCDVITPRRKSRFEAISRRLRISCFGGLGKTSEEI